MDLFFRKIGEQGQPILILHGLFGSSDNWLTVGKKLAEYHIVYLIDQRNHGQSFWSEDWNYEVMSEDIGRFVTQQNIQNAVVLGHSMGGKVAMLFAAHYPNVAQKLVVVDIAPKNYPVHHDDIIEALQSLDLTSISTRQEADTKLSQMIPDAGTRQFLLKNLYRTAENQFAWRINLDIISHKIEEVGRSFPQDLMYHLPTLFVRGAKSRYILQEDIVHIHQHFPKAELITIENAGHWVHAEQPEELFAHLHTFIHKA